MKDIVFKSKMQAYVQRWPVNPTQTNIRNLKITPRVTEKRQYSTIFNVLPLEHTNV